MIKILRFFILLNISILLFFGQSEPSMLRIDYPEFVVAGNSFETSAIFKFNEKPQNSIKLNFGKLDYVDISFGYLISNDVRIPLKLSYSNSNQNDFSVLINTKNNPIKANLPYQIVFECKISGKSTINDEIIFYKGNIVKSSNSFKKKLQNEHPLNFYEVQEVAGNCLSLKSSTSFEIDFINTEEEIPILFEFWMKANSKLDNIFTIKNLSDDYNLFELSKSDLGFASTVYDKNDIAKNDIFIPNSTWNYFVIEISKKNGGVKVNSYINSKLMISKFIPNIKFKETYAFKFENQNSVNVLEIDRIRLSKFNNSLSEAFDNKHFLNYDADSSNFILKLNFDSSSEITNNNKNSQYKIQTTAYDFKRSTAPIFSKSPKLTVTIGSSYNSIVWYVQEYYVAKEFIVEKSTNKSGFKSIYKIMADDDPLKIYYYTDDLLLQNDVAYYRVKQINKDGTEVYSGEVKIGNKNIEEFKLKQNYPNPFNPVTTIYVDVVIPSEFEVNVFDLVGNKIAQLHKGYLTKGLHSFEFKAVNLPSGIYFYEVKSAQTHAAKKMILAK